MQYIFVQMAEYENRAIATYSNLKAENRYRYSVLRMEKQEQTVPDGSGPKFGRLAPSVFLPYGFVHSDNTIRIPAGKLLS